MTGIYKIENLINHKVYIGKSKDIKTRWKCHIKDLNNNSHKNIYLQHSWNKYGPENFIFSILEKCSLKEINEKEKYWINFYGGINSNNTYNIVEGGNGGKGNKKWVEKISKTVKQHYLNGEYFGREKGTQIWINKDRINTKINKNQLKNYIKRGWSKGRINFIIKNKKDLSGSNNPFYGKHHSEESKKKMRKMHNISDEKREIISEKSKKFFSNSKWIHKGNKNKRVLERNIELWISEGWELGRLPLPQISLSLKKLRCK